MSNPADPSFQDQAPARFSAGEDVLSIISGVQSELDRLKTAQRRQAEEEAALEALRHDLDAQRQAVETHAAELETLHAEQDARAGALDAERERAAEKARSLEAQAARLAEEAQAIESARRELDTRAAEQDAEHRRLDEESADQARALDERESALREGETCLADNQEELDAAAARLAEESASLHQQQARFREKQNALEESIAAREKDLDDHEQALAAEKIGVEQASRHAQTLRGELQRERDQLRADQDEVEAEQQRLEQQRAHVVELQSRLERANAEHEDQSGRIAELESERARLTDALASTQAVATGADGELESLRHERDALRADLARATAREAELRASAESTGATAEDADATHAELDKRAHAIEALAGKLRDAQAEIAALRENATTPAARGARAGVDGAVRRERLRRIRRAIHARTRALVKAKETLETRQNDAERVLGQRRALAAVRAQLLERERAIESRAGRNHGFAALFLGVLATLGLGVMSWAVVSRVFPATYLVTATLAADDTSGALSAESRTAWNDSIKNLVKDPRFFEVAADRMRRRGILEFSSAGVLSAHCATNLDLAETAPGQVVLSLTGVGAERTTRILDTFIATAISVANEARTRRSGGAVTTLEQPPDADAEPIQDHRLTYAGVGWGASTGALALLLLLVWLRLSIARKRFDHENAEMLAAGGRPNAPAV